MATIITPGDGRKWDEVFPHAYADSEGDEDTGELRARLGREPMWRTISSVLFLLAAFMTRGVPRIKATERTRVWVINTIVTSWINEVFARTQAQYDSDPHMAELGRSVYWLIKALDTNPVAGRLHGSVSQVKVTIGEPERPADG